MRLSIKRLPELNLLSQFYTMGATIITQLALAPVLIFYWGLGGFGIWATIVAIPYALQVFDLGIGVSSAPKIMRLVKSGETERARILLNRSLQLSFIIAAIISFMLCIILIFWGNNFSVYGMDIISSLIIITAVTIYFIVGLFSSVVNSLFRISPQMWIGGGIYDTGRVLEAIAVILCAMVGEGIASAIAAMTLLRLSFCGLSYFFYFRINNWFKGFRFLRPIPDSPPILQDALHASVLPVSSLILTHAPILIAAVYLKPASIGTYVVLRTVYRFVLQFSSAFFKSRTPIIAQMVMDNENSKCVDYTAKILLASILFAVSMALCISLFIDHILNFWLDKEIMVPRMAPALFSIQAVLMMVWFNLAYIVVTIGYGSILAWRVMAALPIAIASLLLFITNMPVNGIYLGTVVAETIMTVAVVLSLHSPYRRR